MQPLAAVAVRRNRLVGNLLAEIGLDHVNARGKKLRVSVPPVGIGLRMGKIEQARGR